MSTVRRTVTLDAELDVRARELAPDGNFSALVNEVLWAHVRTEGLAALMERDIRERGPIPPEVAEEVGRKIDQALAELDEMKRNGTWRSGLDSR